MSDGEFDESVAACAVIWGDDDHEVVCAQSDYGDRPEDCPINDERFLHWWTKMLRYSATPSSMVAFGRMWQQTDIRDALPTIHVATAVVCKAGRRARLIRRISTPGPSTSSNTSRARA